MKKCLIVLIALLLCACSKTPRVSVSPSPHPEPTVLPEKKEIVYELKIKDRAVADDYFENTAFVGDSRMVDIHNFEAIKAGYLFAEVSLGINKLDTKLIHSPLGEEKHTVYEGLSMHQFDKIYISFGINELGYEYPNIFIDQYRSAIESIKAKAPHAQIIVLLLFPVSEIKDQESQEDRSNNARIEEYNQLIEEMAKELKVYYFKDYHVLTDENGYLRQELTEDGVHLDPEGYALWANALKHATIEVNNE